MYEERYHYITLRSNEVIQGGRWDGLKCFNQGHESQRIHRRATRSTEIQSQPWVQQSKLGWRISLDHGTWSDLYLGHTCLHMYMSFWPARQCRQDWDVAENSRYRNEIKVSGQPQMTPRSRLRMLDRLRRQSGAKGGSPQHWLNPGKSFLILTL